MTAVAADTSFLTEKTHLLCKGKYSCMGDLLFDRFWFNQVSESVYNFNSESKRVKRRSSYIQWCFSPYNVIECSLFLFANTRYLSTHVALFKGKILGARYIIEPNENFNLINVNLPKLLWIMLSLRNLGTEFLIARTTFALIKIVLSTFQFCTAAIVRQQQSPIQHWIDCKRQRKVEQWRNPMNKILKLFSLSFSLCAYRLFLSILSVPICLNR